MTDTHAHLYLSAFEEDLEQVIDRALHSGIQSIWMPGIDASSIEKMQTIESRWPGLFKSFAGLHPCDVHPDTVDQQLEVIKKAIFSGNVAGVGEVGLDTHWDSTYIALQKKVLIQQLEWAQQQNLPFIMHVRDAFDEIMPLIRPFYGKVNGIFHSFAGNLEQAKELTEEGGFLLGINGSITYKNQAVRLFLQNIPLTHIVVETDAPYLTPIPHRGKRNEPDKIPLIIEALQSVYQVTSSQIAQITHENAHKLLNGSLEVNFTKIA